MRQINKTKCEAVKVFAKKGSKGCLFYAVF